MVSSCKELCTPCLKKCANKCSQNGSITPIYDVFGSGLIPYFLERIPCNNSLSSIKHSGINIGIYTNPNLKWGVYIISGLTMMVFEKGTVHDIRCRMFNEWLSIGSYNTTGTSDTPRVSKRPTRFTNR